MEVQPATELDPEDAPPPWTWGVALAGGFLVLSGLVSFLSAPARSRWGVVGATSALLVGVGAVVLAWGFRIRATWTPTESSEEKEWHYRWSSLTSKQIAGVNLTLAVFFGALTVLSFLARAWLLGALLAVVTACTLTLGILFIRRRAEVRG